MKAETVFNVAIHLNHKELKKLKTLIDKRLEEIPPPKKSPFDLTDEEIRENLIKRYFSKKKSDI